MKQTKPRFKVTEKNGKVLVFDTISPIREYVTTRSLVKRANDIYKLFAFLEAKLTLLTNENKALKTALDEQITALANENMALKAQVAALQAALLDNVEEPF